MIGKLNADSFVGTIATVVHQGAENPNLIQTLIVDVTSNADGDARFDITECNGWLARVFWSYPPGTSGGDQASAYSINVLDDLGISHTSSSGIASYGEIAEILLPIAGGLSFQFASMGDTKIARVALTIVPPLAGYPT